jgi:hypothetical protein
MRRVAIAVAAAALLAGWGAGCGGSSGVTPSTALLTGVRVDAESVTFEFKSGPREVKAAYQPKSRIRESGSGRPVPLKGSAYVVIHFVPAATADFQGEQVIPTYTGPRRLSGPGPVLETAKTSDFEADLAWAIGLERRLPFRVGRHGSTVTVSFG